MTMLSYYDGEEVVETSIQDPFPFRNMNERSLRTTVLPQVAISITVPTRICPANPSRRSVKVTNVTGSNIVWIGEDSSVTATTGDYLHSGIGSNNVYWGTGELWGLAVTAAQTVSVAEDVYDA